MNAMMKLTAAALGAMSIAGGVAVAQGTSSATDDARSQTANYGTPPGAALKRDGSLSADPKPTVTMSAPMASDTTSSTMSSAAAPAAASTDTSSADSSAQMPQPRADRN